jgi:hypothetical protein
MRVESGNANPVLNHIVSMELAGMVENWKFDGEAIHIMFSTPASQCACRKPHTWFINRDGRTRCCQCDDAYVQEKLAAARRAAGMESAA